VQDFLILAAFLILGVLTYFAYAPRNIQDVKPKVKIEKKIREIPSSEEKKYKRLNNHFKWLNKKVYAIIIEKSKKNNVDPSLFMSIIKKETEDHCNGDYKCMTKAISKSWAIGISQILPCHILGWSDYLYIERSHKIGKPFKYRGKTWKNRGEVYMYYCYDILIDVEKNIEYGTSYLSACMMKSRGNYSEAVRMYNQGTGTKASDYKNWKYVRGVMSKYKKVLTNEVMAVNYEN
jgi:soluble lytic murein transglycosylase-like protein